MICSSFVIDALRENCGVNISPSPRLNRVYRQADIERQLNKQTGASLPIVREIGIASLTCSFYDPPPPPPASAAITRLSRAFYLGYSQYLEQVLERPLFPLSFFCCQPAPQKKKRGRRKGPPALEDKQDNQPSGHYFISSKPRAHSFSPYTP